VAETNAPVSCPDTSVAQVRALLPEGRRVYLRENGITELPLHGLNTFLEPLWWPIHAAKVQGSKRVVACADRTGRAEWFGLFELRVREG